MTQASSDDGIMPIECTCNQCDLRSMFFKNVKQGEMTVICASKKQKVFENGEIIIREGDVIENFSYLKSGLAKVSRWDQNKEQIIHFAKPFDFVSVLSVFSQQYYQYSVTALDKSVVCDIPMKEILRMSSRNADFAVDLMKRMSEVSDKIILEMIEIRKRNLRGRVAFVLLFFANEVYKSSVFEMPVSRKEVAEYIDMRAENVIRTLSEFRKDKMIKIAGRYIEIVDKENLSLISRLG